jgi:hypothetical protein
MGLRRPLKRRTLAAIATGSLLGAAFVACSSAGDYPGGGRRLVPPGGVGEGGITVVPVDSSPPEDTNVPPPQDNYVPPDTNPPPDAGKG